MFNNNSNNGNSSQNVWDQMALFNQYTLRNILNGRNDLGTPELRAAVASINEEQRDDALVFLECNMEELAGLPDSQIYKLLRMYKHCWTTFQHLSPTQGVIQ